MKRRLLIWWRKARRAPLRPLITYVGQSLLWLLLWSCRIEVHGTHHLIDAARKRRCMLMLWHNRMALVIYTLWHHADEFFYTAVISNSRDGDLLEAIADTYTQGNVLRVPHNAKHIAVKGMVSRLKNGEILIITPDGPRGPRYNVKTGVAFTAKAADAVVIPFTWCASRFWQLKTWDRFMIPKPFSRIVINIGEPHLPNDHKDWDLEQAGQALQQHLKELDEKACRAITSDTTYWPQ